MHSAASACAVASPDGSLIFPQRDRELGSFLGVTRRMSNFGATQSLDGRCSGMHGVDFRLSGSVIAACIEVHRLLGPGLLESIYEECVCRELALRGLRFERQKAISIEYKGTPIDQKYRVDLIIEETLLLEIKAIEALLPIHAAQVVTYLRVSSLPSGLLVNFNAMTIRAGLRRLWRDPQSSRSPNLFVPKI